jgi:RNA polymerase sigma-70 factor (ECF subfamily)
VADEDAPHAADLSLARACAAGSSEALARFEREFMSHVPDFVARIPGAAALADEIQQTLREKLLVGRPDGPPRIREYSGRGALGGWLRVAAVRTAIDLVRQRGVSLGDRLPDPAAIDPSPELLTLRARYQHAYEDALARALAGLDVKQKNLLRLHFVEGLTVDRIGVAFSVHRATAARWVAAARDALLAGAERLLGAELGLTTSEIHSLAGVLASQIHLSISRLLA